MQIQSERARLIDGFVDQHTEIGKWPLDLDGIKTILPFYRFPVELLRYNVDNGRLAMETREWERANGRKLDADQRQDAETIRDMLLALDESKTTLLKADLKSKWSPES